MLGNRAIPIAGSHQFPGERLAVSAGNDDSCFIFGNFCKRAQEGNWIMGMLDDVKAGDRIEQSVVRRYLAELRSDNLNSRFLAPLPCALIDFYAITIPVPSDRLQELTRPAPHVENSAFAPRGTR